MTDFLKGDIDDEKLETALIENERHIDLMEALGKIAELLPAGNKPLIEAVKKHTDVLTEKFIKAIEKLPVSGKPDAPEVNIELNQDKVITSVKELAELTVKSVNYLSDSNAELLIEFAELLVELKKYNERPIPDSFVVTETSHEGFIRAVKINYKTAKEIKK